LQQLIFGSSSEPKRKDVDKKIEEFYEHFHKIDPCHLYTLPKLEIEITKSTSTTPGVDKKWSLKKFIQII
jgi:hypothetical protein